MKTFIFDKEAFLLSYTQDKWVNEKNLFWVECTLWEVWAKILPALPDDRQSIRLLDNPLDNDKFYFWINKDLTFIEQYFAVFPHSAMNDVKQQYLRFYPIEISSLEELKYLDIERLENVKNTRSS